MKTRTLGKTGYQVSEIGYGAWSLGADWGDVSDQQAESTLQALEPADINFIDTADVYGDGTSEKRIAQFLKSSSSNFTVATKAGRRLDPHTADGYTAKNLAKFVDRSLKNLQTDSLDLLQLHCPPTQVYYQLETFDALENLVKDGKVKHVGVSVEKVEEALKAIEYPIVSTVQIIFNIFRQRPMENFFDIAQQNNIGIIVRVPLASGLLTGKYSKKTTFPDNDHRHFNRHGQAFDVGETFAGVPFEIGIEAVESLKQIVPDGFTLPQLALKWILMHPAVSTVIAGGKTPEQVLENSRASQLPQLSAEVMTKIDELYISHTKPFVHHRW